jgi:hypothetical protein
MNYAQTLEYIAELEKRALYEEAEQVWLDWQYSGQVMDRFLDDLETGAVLARMPGTEYPFIEPEEQDPCPF